MSFMKASYLKCRFWMLVYYSLWINIIEDIISQGRDTVLSQLDWFHISNVYNERETLFTYIIQFPGLWNFNISTLCTSAVSTLWVRSTQHIAPYTFGAVFRFYNITNINSNTISWKTTHRLWSRTVSKRQCDGVYMVYYIYLSYI